MTKRILPVVILVLAVANFSWGTVPAPPVNQYLGLGDTTFNNVVEADCRVCHNQTPPEPYPVDPTYLPDRHHLLVYTPIASPSDVPVPDADGDGVADTTYVCLNCHTMTFNPDTGTSELDPDFRDCTQCHIQTRSLIVAPTVHHRTSEAQGGDCAFCHGSFVDSGLLDDDGDGIDNAIDPDGGWVPTYQVSEETPYPGGVVPGSDNRKPDGDPTTTNIWGQQAGNCSFCHSELTGIGGSSDFCGLCHAIHPGDEETPVVENTGPFAPVEVFINATTHHSAGPAGHDNCVWCHSFDVPAGDPRALTPIRTCANCHGIPSLHSIAYDGQAFGFPNNGGTVTPGVEPPGFGHIGNQDDCWGCHGHDDTSAASAPSSGPVIPALYSLSASSVSADSNIVLSGTALVNEVQNPLTGEYDITLTSQVILIDADGFETVLDPASVSGDTIEVDIPSTMPAGNYRIAAKKAQKLSNPLNLAITPELAVTNATCGEGLVTVSGSGFGSYLAATDSGTSVTATVTYKVVTGKGKDKTRTTVIETQAGDVTSWSDTGIEAQFAACPDEVTVDTVFDAIAAAVTVDTPAGCADYGDEVSCSADPACSWNDKKGGVCKKAGGGKPQKNK
jgi:hypothetical protein